MKKIITLAVAMLLTISAFSQSAKSIYNKYSDRNDVSAVFISPAMFRMIGRIPDINIEGSEVNLGSIIKSLSGLYILNCNDPGTNSSLEADVKRFMNRGKYEMMMEAKDKGETVHMYTMGDDNIVEGFVMTAFSDEKSTFIFMDGKMPRKDLERILSEKSK